MLKNKRIILSVLVTSIMMITVFTSGYAAPLLKTKIDFKVINKSDEIVTIHLSGTLDYDIEVLEKETKKVEIEKGEYSLEYTSCGDDFDDTIDLDDDFTMTIYACGIVPTKMRVKSHLPQKITLNMDGPDDYEFNIKLGQTKVELYSGWYAYSYDACDTTFSGEIRVTKNGETELLMHSCEWFDEPARIYGKPNPVKYRIANHASFPVDMYLIGPYTYYLKVYPGMNQYIVVAGSYNYGYYLDNNLYSGRITVLRNGTGLLVITPAHIFGID